MQAGDKVIPAGFPKDYRPGVVEKVKKKKVVVTWTMGSGWKWTVEHDISGLERVG